MHGDGPGTFSHGKKNMTRKNPHLGSSFESWLDEEGIREEVTAAAIKAVIALQLADEMKKKKITKQRMAELMKTSRAHGPSARSRQRERNDRESVTGCTHRRPPTENAIDIIATAICYDRLVQRYPELRCAPKWRLEG